MLKYLLIDLETTGDGTSIYHDIVEIYAELWCKGKLLGSFHRKFSHNNTTIFSGGMNYGKAVKHKEEMRQSSDLGIEDFITWLIPHGKVLFVSYNAVFDFTHVKNWLKRNKRKEILFNQNPICIMTLIALRMDRYYKLPDACRVMGITVDTKKLHAAKYDVELLRNLFNKLTTKLRL